MSVGIFFLAYAAGIVVVVRWFQASARAGRRFDELAREALSERDAGTGEHPRATCRPVTSRSLSARTRPRYPGLDDLAALLQTREDIRRLPEVKR